MDNFERGDKAAQALKAVGYESAEDTADLSLPTPDGGEVRGTADCYPIADLIADLLHLAQRNGAKVDDIIERGVKHYGADCVEQAFHASEEWGEELTGPLNVARAAEVLEACGVPEQYHYGVFVYVGLKHGEEKED